MPRIKNSLSMVPFQLKPCIGGNEEAVATGFLYEHGGRTFLVTNYHVVSGRHPETGSVITKCGLCPDSIQLGIPVASGRREPSSELLVELKWFDMPLFTNDEPAKPIWFEHPSHGRRLDVVAIDVDADDEFQIVPANSEAHDLEAISIYPGMDAFIIGFPLGMGGPGHLPLWKRGTIATEPDFDLDHLPKFLVDTATREGMSGAPVYAQEVGYWLPDGEIDARKASLGKGCRFVGVYSGRLGANDEFKAQLGVVWKESALISLLESVPRRADAS